jgi:hypothetical protein
MPPCNRFLELGPGHAAWGAGAPWLAFLATALGRWAGGWAWVSSMVVPRSKCEEVLEFSIFFLCTFLSTRSGFVLSLLFLCIFACFQVCVLQNMFLQKQVELGQSISICVKVCLFLLFLDYNWRL